MRKTRCPIGNRRQRAVKRISAAENQADEEADTKRAEDGLGGILADVIFCRNMEFLRADAGVLPLLGGGFAEVLGPVRRCGFERRGFFGGGGFELARF